MDDASLLHELGHSQIEKSPGVMQKLQQIGIATGEEGLAGQIGKAAIRPIYEGAAWKNAIQNAAKGSKFKVAGSGISPLLTYLLHAGGTLGGAYYGLKSLKELVT